MTLNEAWLRVRARLPAPARAAGWRVVHAVRPARPGLLMHWAGGEPPPPVALPTGYELRQWRTGDDEAWRALLNASDAFGPWDAKRMELETRNVIRRCQQFIVNDGKIIAATGVTDRPLGRQHALEVSWVVRDPAHSGRALGRAVLVAATRAALAEPGGRPVFLYTDDHRLTAITLYLELGFVPDLHGHRSYSARWEAVFGRLARRGRPPAMA